jgi:hypothetical protein
VKGYSTFLLDAHGCLLGRQGVVGSEVELTHGVRLVVEETVLGAGLQHAHSLFGRGRDVGLLPEGAEGDGLAGQLLLRRGAPRFDTLGEVQRGRLFLRFPACAGDTGRHLGGRRDTGLDDVGCGTGRVVVACHGSRSSLG